MCAIGFAYGAFQSYARASFAELIPPGEEARWYGLFSITDKACVFFTFPFTLTLMIGLVEFVCGAADCWADCG